MATKLHELLGLKKEEKILLDQNQICSPQAFLDQPNFSLQKILNVSARQTERQKEILREKIRLDVVKGSAYLAKCRESQQFFSTGIEQFDDLFTNKAITSGDIIEIIGLAATGKTMLLNTILINVFEQVDNIDVYFIDTKHDFKATKLANMMDARGMSETKKLQVLKQIIIERVGTPEDLVKSLRFLLNTRGQHENVKLIMIDSITVPFYLYSGHSMFNLSLMNQTFELLKALAKENIAILLTNHAYYEELPPDLNITPSIQSQSSESSESSPSTALTGHEKRMKVVPALGRFWGTTAHHKVLIDFLDYPHQFDRDLEEIERNMSLFSSKFAAPTEPQRVEITDQGMF